MTVRRIVISGAAALAACGVLGIAAPAVRASSPSAATWTQQAPAVRPTARVATAMAYDAATGTTVLFGGFGRCECALGDTWTWDGTTWTQQALRPARPPGPRGPWPMTRPPAPRCCSAGTTVLLAAPLTTSLTPGRGDDLARPIPLPGQDFLSGDGHGRLVVVESFRLDELDRGCPAACPGVAVHAVDPLGSPLDPGGAHLPGLGRLRIGVPRADEDGNEDIAGRV